MADGSQRPSDVVGDLRRETEVARSLLANMRDIIGDDEDVVASTVEGETDLIEAIGAGVKRLVEIDVLMDAAKAMADSIKERRARWEKQHDLLKEAIALAMESGEIRKLELPLATISLKRVPPSALIPDEWLVPERFFKPQDPKLDKKAVLDALKAGEVVPGATLSNGGQSLQVRLK